MAAVLRVDPTVASARSASSGPATRRTRRSSARGRGFLVYWVPAGHDLVLLEWLVWADQRVKPACRAELSRSRLGPMHSDEEAAALCEVLNPWGPSDDFYLALVMVAGSALDIGCGTGALLHRARQAGHAGRLCGVDPDRASLALARRRTDIEWMAGTAASMAFDSEFDLAIMTGHAVQVLVGDDELRASLGAIRRALVDGGHFVFETRNPLAWAWESWNPRNAADVVDPSGRHVRVWHEVESVVGDVVTLSETTSDPDGVPLRVDRASLRFPDVDTLTRFLADAGFQVEARYGGWFREPLEPASPEIVTVARSRGG